MYICVCIYTYTHTNIYVQTYVCMYIHIYVPARAGAESRRTGGRGELPGLCRLEAGALIALMPAPIRHKGEKGI